MAKKNPPGKTYMAPILLEGQNLGKYRILEPLGRGGMAQVFKAYHPGLDRFVAVKVLRSDLVEEADFLSRFRREARAVAALRHPNIVQVYDFDTQDDLYYMVMELLEGDSLRTYLNAYRAGGEVIPAGKTVRIIGDALAGLVYAHNQGIIHRDLKPANIMLSRHGQAVLTDFGIAQIVGSTQYTVSGALMGTLSYMAPEQGLTGQCDPRSDLYSLAIIYYEMLTGRVPFDADTPLAILMKHVNDPLPLPVEVNPAIPSPLAQVAVRALAGQPAERYQSAVEMAEALKEASREAAVDVPDTLALPLPVTVTASVFEPVAVFSGEARRSIPDPAFAEDDTQVTPGLQAGAGSTSPVKHTGRAALGGVAFIAGANMMMLWLGGIFGWEVFGYTWPMELLAIGFLLSALMVSAANPWLLIPGGIALGNGLLLSYFSLTGRWDHWSYVWPLEPILVVISVYAPFLFRRSGSGVSRWLRRLGISLLLLAILAFGAAMVTAVYLLAG